MFTTLKKQDKLQFSKNAVHKPAKKKKKPFKTITRFLNKILSHITQKFRIPKIKT